MMWQRVLIEAAKRERRNRRSGRNLILALAVAAVCARRIRRATARLMLPTITCAF